MVLVTLGAHVSIGEVDREMTCSHLAETPETMLVLHPVCPAVRPSSECRLPVVNGSRGGTQISDHPRRVLGAEPSDLQPKGIRVLPRGATLVDNPHCIIIIIIHVRSLLIRSPLIFLLIG